MKKNIKAVSILALILAVLSSCGTTNNASSSSKNEMSSKMPDWVTAPATVYPTSKYFSYVGDGSNRTKAEINALNGLASIFGQDIKSTTETSKKMTQAQADGKVATAKTEAFDQSVLKNVDVDNLIGVEISEFWYDNKDTWYAIALMNKSKATEIYSSMIAQNNSTIDELLKMIKEDELSIENYSAYDFAQDIAVENEKYLKRISVINPDKYQTLKNTCISSKEIASKKLALAKKIPIYVSFENDVDGRIKAAFVESISKLGFIATVDSKARYTLKGTIIFTESVSSDKKTTKCQYNLDSFLLDSQTNHQLTPVKINGRESFSNFDEAKNRAVKSMEKKIKTDFSKEFTQYIKDFVAE